MTRCPSRTIRPAGCIFFLLALLLTGAAPFSGTASRPGAGLAHGFAVVRTGTPAWSAAEISWQEALFRSLPRFVLKDRTTPLRLRRLFLPGTAGPVSLRIDTLKKKEFSLLVDPRFSRQGRQYSREYEKHFKRALVQAVLLLVDRDRQWSARHEWRAINSWRGPLSTLFTWKTTANNRSPQGFVSPAGRQSPALDLATFAAAFFVPEEAYTDKPDPEKSIRNILISQYRFLSARIRETEPGYTPRIDRLTPESAAFARWANLDRISHVELILAAPSSVSLASLFGHLFLRVVPKSDTDLLPFFQTPVFGFVADFNGPIERDSWYVLKGIFGKYRAIMTESVFQEFHHQYRILENRDLRRWRINLDRGQLRTLLERIWTIRMSAEYKYYFFSSNCASFLIDLCNSILPGNRQLKYTGGLFSAPTATLDAYASYKFADGRPFLTLLPETYPGLENEAIAASRLKRARADSILGRLRATYPSRRYHELRRAFAEAAHRDGERRAAAYRRVVAALPGTDTAADLYAWLRHCLVVEYYFSRMANLRQEQRLNSARIKQIKAALPRLSAALPPLTEAVLRPALLARARTNVHLLRRFGPAFAGDPARTVRKTIVRIRQLLGDKKEERRVEGYILCNSLVQALLLVRPQAGGELPARLDRLADTLRLLVRYSSYINYDYSLRKVPGLITELLLPVTNLGLNEQPWHEAAGALCNYRYVTELSTNILRLNDDKQTLLRQSGFRPDPLALEDTLTTRQNRVQEERYRRSWGLVGIDPLRLSGTWLPGNNTFGLVLKSALIREDLGDMRRHGFVSHSGLSVLDSELTVLFIDDTVKITDFRSRMLGLRSLRTLLPEASSWTRGIGWQLYVDYAWSKRRGLAAVLEAHYGLSFPLAASADCRNHLLLNIGPFAGYDIPRRDPGGETKYAVGPLVQLEGRFTLPFSRDYMNGNRTLLEYRPFYDLAAGRWRQECRVKSDLVLVLSRGFTPFWSKRNTGLRLFAGAEYWWKDYALTAMDNRKEWRLTLGLELN